MSELYLADWPYLSEIIASVLVVGPGQEAALNAAECGELEIPLSALINWRKKR